MRMVTELASRVSPFFPTSGHSGITSSRKSIWKDTWTRALVNALGNIAVIGPEINIRISAKDPMKYIAKYDISDEKLSQQFIDPKSISLSQEGYKTWVQDRAARLAEVANGFFAELAPPPPEV